jgi:uncharacterized SAM-binding protein YcdF (DUF218 family)
LPRTVKILAGLFAAATFGLLAGLMLFAASVAHYTPRIADTAVVPVDAIVVLTGGEHRVREGLRLFTEGHARRILISGVNRSTTRDDLRRMAGLPPIVFDCCIDVGYEALDTAGNADEARAWAAAWGFQRLIVVTSNYHMPRSLAEFARAMPRVAFVPHPVISTRYHAESWWLYPNAARIVVSEYLKFIVTTARFAATRVAGHGAPPTKAVTLQGFAVVTAPAPK